MKIVLALVISLVAFIGGLAATYFLVPSLLPEKAVEAQAHIDSLAIVDSLMQVYSQGAIPDSSWAELLTEEFSKAEGEEEVVDSTDTIADIAPDSVAVVADDSLASMAQQIESLQQTNKRLLAEINSLKSQQQDRSVQESDVEALSNTLSKLEDKDLGAIVEQLDLSELRALYEQSSAKNRARLLQAMPASAAANFVRHLIDPTKKPVSTENVTEPDSLSSADASNALPENANE